MTSATAGRQKLSHRLQPGVPSRMEPDTANSRKPMMQGLTLDTVRPRHRNDPTITRAHTPKNWHITIRTQAYKHKCTQIATHTHILGIHSPRQYNTYNNNNNNNNTMAHLVLVHIADHIVGMQCFWDRAIAAESGQGFRQSGQC